VVLVLFGVVLFGFVLVLILFGVGFVLVWFVWFSLVLFSFVLLCFVLVWLCYTPFRSQTTNVLLSLVCTRPLSVTLKFTLALQQNQPLHPSNSILVPGQPDPMLLYMRDGPGHVCLWFEEPRAEKVNEPSSTCK